MEEPLPENKDTYRTLVENLNIGIYRVTFGDHGRYIQANPAMVRMFGYAYHEEFMEVPASNLYQNPDDRTLFLEEVFREGFVKNKELFLRKKDGTPIWCSCTATAQYDEQGKVKWIDGALEDITDRKSSEAALQESKERLRTLYRYSPVPTTTWQMKDNDFVLVDYNIAQEEFTDGRAVNVFEKQASEIYHNRPDIINDMFRCFHERTVLKREMPYRVVTTGADKFIIFTYAYVPPDLIIIQFEDITARKKAEEELRALSSKLMVIEEKERKRIAREIHDSIGQYLTAIKFKMDRILEQLMIKEVDTAMESARTGIPLVQQTIEEVRRIIMDLRPTILDDLGILATITWLSREFQAVYANIRVEQMILLEEHHIPEPLKIIIFRIIQESMNNAAKYSKANRIRITLKLVKNRIELSIIDNGIGFYSKHTHKGLGLITMRERVESSGGKLFIRSWKWIGTLIRASWPR
jgi:PAS domain S-box-containing protein